MRYNKNKKTKKYGKKYRKNHNFSRKVKKMNGGTVFSKPISRNPIMTNVDMAIEYFNNAPVSKVNSESRNEIIRNLESFKLNINSRRPERRVKGQEEFEIYMHRVLGIPHESEMVAYTEQEKLHTKHDTKLSDAYADELIKQEESERQESQKSQESQESQDSVVMDIPSSPTSPTSPTSPFSDGSPSSDGSPGIDNPFSLGAHKRKIIEKEKEKESRADEQRAHAVATRNLNEQFEQVSWNVSKRTERIFTKLNAHDYGESECQGYGSSLCRNSIGILSQHRIKAIRKTNDYVYFYYQMSTGTGGVPWYINPTNIGGPPRGSHYHIYPSGRLGCRIYFNVASRYPEYSNKKFPGYTTYSIDADETADGFTRISVKIRNRRDDPAGENIDNSGNITTDPNSFLKISANRGNESDIAKTILDAIFPYPRLTANYQIFSDMLSQFPQLILLLFAMLDYGKYWRGAVKSGGRLRRNTRKRKNKNSRGNSTRKFGGNTRKTLRCKRHNNKRQRIRTKRCR
jgi:hypothetical protein